MIKVNECWNIKFMFFIFQDEDTFELVLRYVQIAFFSVASKDGCCEFQNLQTYWGKKLFEGVKNFWRIKT